jgi:signal transduction histidine kinase
VAGPLRAVRSHPRIVDGVVALTMLLSIVLVEMIKPHQLHGHLLRQQRTPATDVLLVVGCVVLVFRRYWPRATLAATVVCALASLFVTPQRDPVNLVVAVAMYNVTLVVDRRAALALGGATAAALVAGNIVLSGGSWVDSFSLLDIAMVGMAFGLGDAIRNRRAYLAEVVGRAQRAEQSREEEARRRVTEERLRIARDLHDVVAHHIALINVQAGVGSHFLDERPEQSRIALEHIRRASRSALEELSATIGLLRQPDDPRAPTDPTVGLARLDELVAGLAGVGLRVDREVTGAVTALPAAVDLTAYRIVQEALTNVHKHANTDSARLRIGVDGDTVRIVVDDRGPAPTTPNPTQPTTTSAPAPAPASASAREPATGSVTGSGHGMLGMRERAAAVGGTLAAGPRPEGGFRVEATLPVALTDYEPVSG